MMIIDEDLRQRLIATFLPLNTVAAANAFPPPTTLSKTLEKAIPTVGSTERNISAAAASYFGTAAVDMWLRSVHSFLISSSITASSPIWASVSGYYSSHYSVRGLAHLLGYFQLFKLGRIVNLRFEGRRCVCSFAAKTGRDAEHKLYWKLVKQNPLFKGDDLFTDNDQGADMSDVRHRNHANYSDHLSHLPLFKAPDEDALKRRIEYISKIVFDTAPLPSYSKFPDIDCVQLVAYHRLVRFRRLLDEALGGENRFWRVHRSPSFANNFMDFQLAEAGGLTQLGGN